MAGFRDTKNVHHSDTPSWDSGGTAGILDEERKRATFDVETLTYFLDGGKKETIRRRWIAESTEDKEGVGGTSKRYDLERTGEKGGIAQNFIHFMEIHKKHLDKFYVPKGNEMMYMSMAQTMAGYPGFGLFLTTVAGQSSADQLGWWLPLVYTMKITGSYGHGSNVRGLETTAVYDKSTQEFVLNTPTLASMKWWPSSMATSTHCVLYAQLIIDGKEYGLHVFFLQLRDENLEPLPGIEVGDLGSKAGENEVDIGYLRLKNVRVPRRHMFEKRQHVEPDGRYVKHDMGGDGNDKGAYLTMMFARVTLVAGASVFLSKGATIAVRYNAVRKQGFKDTAKGKSYKSQEYAIIDYKMNQYVLMRELSLAFAIRFTSNWLSERMNEMQTNPEDNAADLPELHASSTGLKGYCCDAAAKGLENLRLTCGGAGYLEASGIAPLVADYKWRATAEGETNVMLLQTARFLLKSAREAEQGKPLSGLTQCLSVLKDPNFDPLRAAPPAPKQASDLFSLEYLLKWFEYRTITQVLFTKQALDARMKAGESFDQAWGELTLRAVYTGRSHVLYFMLNKFAAVVATCEDAAVKAVLQRVCALFALSDMIDGKQWTGLLDVHTFVLVEQAVSQVCAQLRPDAVALVDAWDYTDRALGSTIGNKAGDVYEQQYLAAANAPTNEKLVPDYLKAIEPYLDKEFLALRNKPSPFCDPNDTECYPDEAKPSARL